MSCCSHNPSLVLPLLLLSTETTPYINEHHSKRYITPGTKKSFCSAHLKNGLPSHSPSPFCLDYHPARFTPSLASLSYPPHPGFTLKVQSLSSPYSHSLDLHHPALTLSQKDRLPLPCTHPDWKAPPWQTSPHPSPAVGTLLIQSCMYGPCYLHKYVQIIVKK